MWKIFIFITLLTFLRIHLSNAIKINCEYSEIDHLFGKLKKCTASKVASTEPNTKLSEVNCSRDLNEFGAFSISQSPDCYYLPKEITKHFTNLIYLSVAHTGLKSITKEDLKPFEYLRGLYITHSELTSLDDDLFRYNKKLERLTLMSNKIHYIEVGTFKPLQNLTGFYFGNSICIKDIKDVDGRRTVERAMKEVEAKCQNNRDAGETATEVKVNQQGAQEVSKESTTERHGFLA